MRHRRTASKLMDGGPRHGTVLVLEDEPIIAFALEDMLLDLGFTEVLHASSLAQAGAFIRENHLSAAVLDVNIHGQHSYPLAAVLRDKAVPFIFATGYGDAQHPADLSLVPTLTKPYNSAALEQALAATRS